MNEITYLVSAQNFFGTIFGLRVSNSHPKCVRQRRQLLKIKKKRKFFRLKFVNSIDNDYRLDNDPSIIGKPRKIFRI